MTALRIGLLGCGVVGRGFVELVGRELERIRTRSGIDLQIARILVRDPDKERPGVDARLLTTRAIDVLDDGCDLIVELVGGIECAGAYVRRALHNGRHVVTANKALLAAAATELFDTARRNGLEIGFEASVCGGVPIVRALQRGLAGDSIDSISGILNGTCNYVLTRMDEEGLELDEAVRLAQARGFAEADPTLDVEGIDAAQKLQILASLAFDDRRFTVKRLGIRGVKQDEVRAARTRGEVLRHVATARRNARGIELRVEPVALPREHPLARVRDENNGVIVRGRATGELFFAGRGAGPLPTAAAVLSDVIEIGTRHASERRRLGAGAPAAGAPRA
jgi:homoserine dehydrogenase